MERRGKSSPAQRRRLRPVNPTRSNNDRSGLLVRNSESWRERGSDPAPRQMTALNDRTRLTAPLAAKFKTDHCLQKRAGLHTSVNNQKYKPCFSVGSRGLFVVDEISSVQRIADLIPDLSQNLIAHVEMVDIGRYFSDFFIYPLCAEFFFGKSQIIVVLQSVTDIF